MKKKEVRIFLYVAMLMLVFALVGCGSKDTQKKDSDDKIAEQNKDNENKEDNDKDSAKDDQKEKEDDKNAEFTGKFASVEEFAESDMLQEQIDGLKKMISSMGLDVVVTGEDNKLIYTYRYLEDVQMDGLAEALSTQLNTQAATFESIASSLKAAVDVENPVVVVTYQNVDGTEIYSQEFMAE